MADHDDLPDVLGDDGPKVLTPKGEKIVKRGGADGKSDDDMLVLEIAAKAPGMSPDDLAACFIAIRMEFGEDGRRALREGHVRFEPRKPQ